MTPVAATPIDAPSDPLPDEPLRRPTLWTPKRVLVTKAAAEQPHTAEILRRCEAAGVTDLRLLPGDRLTGLSGGSDRESYARAKSTLAAVVAPPSVLTP